MLLAGGLASGLPGTVGLEDWVRKWDEASPLPPHKAEANRA